MIATTLLVLSSAPGPDVLARMGFRDAVVVDAFLHDCRIDLPSDVAGALRFYSEMRTKLTVTTAELEACAQGHDVTCAWTNAALVQLCGHPRAPRLTFAPGSTAHAIVRAVAAGLAETADRRRALQLFGTGNSDPFSAFRSAAPTSFGGTSNVDKVVNELIDAKVIDTWQRAAAQRALTHLNMKLMALGKEEYSKMPMSLRLAMLRGDVSSLALLDYATQNAHTWCGRLDDPTAWKAAARPGGATADHVCRNAEERDVCMRIFNTRAGTALVRSAAVFVVATCR